MTHVLNHSINITHITYITHVLYITHMAKLIFIAYKKTDKTCFYNFLPFIKMLTGYY